jgi:hypothetical protein
MKLFFVLTLLTLANITIYANSTDERHYEEGPLTWYDFQGEPIENNNITAQIRYLSEYHPEEEERNDTTFTLIKTSNYFNKSAAWVSDGHRTGLALTYFQVMFDIREFFRRELEIELNQTEEIHNLTKMHNAYFEKGSVEIQRFNLESESGFSREVVLKWEALYAKKLNQTSSPTLPYVKDANWAYGANVGLNSSFNTGTMSEFLTNNYGFSYGGDLGYRDFTLFLQVALVYGDIKKPFDYEKTWEPDMGTTTAVIDLSLGYPILDNSTHRLIPFLGFGVHEISVSNSVEEMEGINLTRYSYIFGFCYDFNLSTSANITSLPGFSGSKFSNQQNIRLRLYASDVNNDVFKGNSINLSLGYSFYTKMIDLIE